MTHHLMRRFRQAKQFFFTTSPTPTQNKLLQAYVASIAEKISINDLSPTECFICPEFSEDLTISLRTAVLDYLILTDFNVNPQARERLKTVLACLQNDDSALQAIHHYKDTEPDKSEFLYLLLHAVPLFELFYHQLTSRNALSLLEETEEQLTHIPELVLIVQEAQTLCQCPVDDLLQRKSALRKVA